jgi:hypothetical protein
LLYITNSNPQGVKGLIAGYGKGRFLFHRRSLV